MTSSASPGRRGRLARLALVLSLALMLFSLAGCVTLNDPESTQDYHSQVVATVQPGHPVGQTFVSHRPRLARLLLWLRPLNEADKSAGSLHVTLYHSQQEADPLFAADFPFAQFAASQQLTLNLPPHSDLPDQSYYLELSAQGGQVEARGRIEDQYPCGQAFQDGTPLPGDLGFRLGYDYDLSALFGDLRQATGNAWLIISLALSLALMLFLPGGWMLYAVRAGRWLDTVEWAAVALGLSLAFYPVLMTWTTLLGLRWGSAALWGGAGVFTLAWLLLAVYRRRFAPRPGLQQGQEQLRRAGDSLGLNLALAAVFLFVLALRLIMVRDLAAPPWVDPVHHAMITRLIVEQGGYPPNYAPFLDIETARYHSGYHSLLAAFHWLSGLELSQAMLLLGQVLNALAATLAVYLFTTTLLQDRAAGVWAALIAGVLTPMPAYYTSWGRYTQLAGLVLLPVALRLILEVVGRGNAHSRIIYPYLLAGLACAGLFLIHYRVLAFLVALLLLTVWGWGKPSLFNRGADVLPVRRLLTGTIAPLAGVAALAVLLSLPWWPETLSSLLIPKLSWGEKVTPAFSDFSWSYLTSAGGRYSLGLAGLGWAWAVYRRRGFALALPLWAVLMFGMANLGALKLPGANYINNTSVEISLYLPIAALGGYLLSQLSAAWQAVLPPPARRLLPVALVVLGGLVALWGARSLLPILNPVTFLFRQADRPAMAWIAENVPQDETIAINPFNWGYGLYAGNDGGFWITPLAGRRTLPPPVLYGLDNAAPRARQITDASKQILAAGGEADRLADILRENGVRYIYIGARGGSISPRALLRSALFDVVYQNDGVWVFKMKE